MWHLLCGVASYFKRRTDKKVKIQMFSEIMCIQYVFRCYIFRLVFFSLYFGSLMLLLFLFLLYLYIYFPSWHIILQSHALSKEILNSKSICMKYRHITQVMVLSMQFAAINHLLCQRTTKNKPKYLPTTDSWFRVEFLFVFSLCVCSTSVFWIFYCGKKRAATTRIIFKCMNFSIWYLSVIAV